MRIRKNAKLSSLLGLSSLSSAASSQSHMCQLNQSPWDVISFSHDSLPPTSSSSFHPDHRHLHLLQGDDSLTINASFCNYLGAVDSSGIKMAVDDDDCIRTGNWKHEEAPDGNHDDDNDNSNDSYGYYQGDNSNTGGGASEIVSVMRVCCGKTNGKGWQCSREAKEGHYLCEHHLKPHQDASKIVGGGFASNEPPPSSARKGGPGRRGRPPKRGPSSSKLSEANNSNQFYYYSGFGPSWGRQRTVTVRSGSGGSRGEEDSSTDGGDESIGWSSYGQEGIDDAVGMGDEEEKEDEEEVLYGKSSGGGRKRTRKPVKARSLKSLM